MKVQRRTFPVWRVVHFGYGATEPKEFALDVQAINEGLEGRATVKVSGEAASVLCRPNFIFARQRLSIDLALVTVQDIGLPQKASLAQICHCGQRLRLCPCPQETGYKLRLDYLDQPAGQRLLVVSAPIKMDGYTPDIFLVDRDKDHLWLRAAPGNAAGLWDGGEFKLVFMLAQRAHY